MKPSALESLTAARRPLVLSPASRRGWFGGMALVAWDPVEVRDGLTLDQAAALLETTYTDETPVLTGALFSYDGSAVVARYAGWLANDGAGWRAYGQPLADADAIRAALDAEPVAAETAAGVQASALPPASLPLLRDAKWDLAGRDFRAAVDAARERIAAGDVYVLNLTARLTGAPVLSPARSFLAVTERAGADMSAFLDGWPGATPWLASVSPERFVRLQPGEHGARLVDIEPIKGTRPRGATPASDAQFAAALAEDPKERAEHVMVVDLERNDLGVVATPGTVHVDPLYEVVTTPYCHQLVSTVRATMRSSATFAQLFAATFPCGSVTGAPKRSAVRIARELERSPRAAYCGALIVAMPGRLDSSVLIRTLEGTRDASVARWGAGCGITHDSDPAAEQLEALLKASPVLGDGAPPIALRETVRVAYGRAPLLDRHLARLAAGGAGPTVLAHVRQAVAEQLAAIAPQAEYARLGVTVTPDGAVAAGISLDPSSLAVAGGPRLVPVLVADTPPLPPGAAKPAVRRYWDRAHHTAQLHAGDQAVLHTADGVIVDGSTASIWLVLGGQLVTPPAPPAVAGVCRELVFDVARQLGVRASERPLTLRDLDAADEVLLSNGVGLVVAAAGRRGPLGDAVRAEVARVFSAAEGM